ncbi:MAG: SPFH domain-containing protein [Patescibacteria group bacterium]
MTSERVTMHQPGIKMAVILFILLVIWVGILMWAGVAENPVVITVATILMLATLFCCRGFIIVNPNQAVVVQLFGKYVGSVKQNGFWWVNPFTNRKMFSLRIHNFETGKLKVNDHDGNPIEIAAVVVWNVMDTAEAAFNVEDYKDFVRVQSESAVRNLATSFPYDAHDDGKQSLRSNTNEIAGELKKEIQDRLSKAGIEVIEARISHLAYAPEIASAMLRRQQANAIIAARQLIVKGAVSMVEMALQQLEESKMVKLDDERKASMVSNLLVVLTSDRDAQPVVNTGSLYQ